MVPHSRLRRTQQAANSSPVVMVVLPMQSISGNNNSTYTSYMVPLVTYMLRLPHHTSPTRLHQQVPSHLRKRYHAANTNRSNSSLITNHKLEILKGCARYPQVSILGIWNSHVEPVSLTLAKLACAFWHTLGMRHKNHCHTHTSCTHRDEMSQCPSHYFVHQLDSKTNP